MGRKELERRLTALGYESLERVTRGYVAWIGRRRVIAVPQIDIIRDDVADAILATATAADEDGDKE